VVDGPQSLPPVRATRRARITPVRRRDAWPAASQGAPDGDRVAPAASSQSDDGRPGAGSGTAGAVDDPARHEGPPGDTVVTSEAATADDRASGGAESPTGGAPTGGTGESAGRVSDGAGKPDGDAAEGGARGRRRGDRSGARGRLGRLRHLGLVQSFNWAIEGLVWTLRYQRNMQIHFAIAVIVVVASLAFAVTRVELLLVFAAITFVFVTEMINTAVEHVVDMITDEHHPAAKIAKDVAAGAVFVAALFSLAVAYLVFYDHIVDIPYSFLRRLRVSEVDLTVVALLLVGLLVIVLKAAVGRGTALRGGWPSGHAAVAFGGWVAVTFIATRTAYAIPISFIALILAFLTAQSRVQAGIHSTLEVVAGALLGIVVTAGVFFIWNPF